MKAVLICAIILAVSSQKLEISVPTFEQGLNLLDGYIECSLSEPQTYELSNCSYDVGVVLVDVQDILQYLKADPFSFLNWVAIIKDIVKIAGVVSPAIKDCSKVITDVEDVANIFENVLSEGLNPLIQQLAFALIEDSKDIFKNVNALVTDFENGKWHDIGCDVGNLTKIILKHYYEVKAKLAKEKQVFLG